MSPIRKIITFEAAVPSNNDIAKAVIRQFYGIQNSQRLQKLLEDIKREPYNYGMKITSDGVGDDGRHRYEIVLSQQNHQWFKITLADMAKDSTNSV